MSAPAAWTFPEEAIDANTSRFRPRREGRPVGREALFAALRSDAACRLALSRTLAEHRFEGFFFETPPIGESLAGLESEFVLVSSAAVAGLRADPQPFAAPLAASPGPVICTPNLSGDAWLVVPRPQGPPAAYAHLARFVREGPPAQVDATWAALGDAVLRWRASRAERLWVSTSGLGVSWLHLRLDTRPKYYSFGAYRRSGGLN